MLVMSMLSPTMTMLLFALLLQASGLRARIPCVPGPRRSSRLCVWSTLNSDTMFSVCALPQLTHSMLTKTSPCLGPQAQARAQRQDAPRDQQRTKTRTSQQRLSCRVSRLVSGGINRCSRRISNGISLLFWVTSRRFFLCNNITGKIHTGTKMWYWNPRIGSRELSNFRTLIKKFVNAMLHVSASWKFQIIAARLLRVPVWTHRLISVFKRFVPPVLPGHSFSCTSVHSHYFAIATSTIAAIPFYHANLMSPSRYSSRTLIKSPKEVYAEKRGYSANGDGNCPMGCAHFHVKWLNNDTALLCPIIL